MKKLHYALLFIAVVAVLLVALFVGRAYRTEAVTSQLSIVPQTASIVGYVQLNQAMKDGDIAEIYTVLPKEAGDPQTIQEALAMILETSHLDLSGFHEVWIFGDVWEDFGEESYFGAILKGTFDEATLLADMIRAAAGEELVVLDHLGHAVYREPGQQLGFAVLTRDLLLYGSIQAIKDVISVSKGNMAPVNPDLLNAYEGLGHAMVKLVAAIPPGLVEENLQALTAGIRTPPALNSLADLKLLSVAIDKKGQSFDCTTHLHFSNKESANTINGLIPLVPLLIGAIDLPDGSMIQSPERALALLPELLTRSEFGTHGSSVTIRSVINAATIEEAMSPTVPPSGLAINLSLYVNSLTSDGLGISIDTTVTSYLGVQIDIGDLRLTVKSKNGQTYITEFLAGTSVPNKSSAAFQYDLVIPLNLAADKDLVITAHTTAKAGGLNMPLTTSIDLVTPGIETLIAIPEIDLAVGFGQLASDGLHMELQTTIANSNPFGIDTGDLLIVAKGQAGNPIFTTSMEGCSLGPDSVNVLSSNLLMPLDVLNEPNVVITIQTQAGFAGVSLPVGARITASMPDMTSLIKVPKIEAHTELSLVSGYPFPEICITVTSTIPNANSIGFVIGDVQATFLNSQGDLLKQLVISGGEIKPHSSRTFSGSFNLSVQEYFDLISGDHFRIEIATTVGMSGLNALIPIETAATMTMLSSSLLNPPNIDLDLNLSFWEITPDGLHIGLQISLNNLSPFGIDVDDLTVAVKDQSGNVLITAIVNGFFIEPQTTGAIMVELLIPTEVLDELDESVILIMVHTMADFAEITLPLIANLVLVNDT